MKGRAFHVFIMTAFATATPRKTPSENQRAAALLMLHPSGLRFWDQLLRLDSLILLTFAFMCFDLGFSSARMQIESRRNQLQHPVRSANQPDVIAMRSGVMDREKLSAQRGTWRPGKPSRLALSALTVIMIKTETLKGQNPGILRPSEMIPALSLQAHDSPSVLRPQTGAAWWQCQLVIIRNIC